MASKFCFVLVDWLGLFFFYKRSFIKFILYIEDIESKSDVVCLEKLYKGELFHQTLSPGFQHPVPLRSDSNK